ncbi:sugar transferase [Baekduia sp. Peel2402]|uniref:sugar transferase n=1 Tax=Baekduia sp. Peel2402 TaxID=3458296 RepID=UPI00403ED1AE
MDATTTSTTAAPATVGDAAVAAEQLLVEARAGSWACRALDIFVSAILLILLAPLLALLAVAIRLDSRGPALFRQVRYGRRQVPFTVNKFRTMWTDAGHEQHRRFVQRLIAGEDPGEDEGTPGFRKIKRDPRVTRVGHYLRKSSLDELPQLWNVLKGEMSLVGPRPPIHYEVEHYPAHWFGRFAVKPGITGLWQISGRSELTLEEMIELDLEYARTRSFWLNLKILVRTIPAVLFARGAA